MKFTLFLALVSATIVLISCEDCRTVGDCNHVSCDSSTSLGCSHGQCTCLSNTLDCHQVTCASLTDCSQCTCRNDQGETHHCFDGHCLCGRPPIVGGPGGPVGPIGK